MFPDIKGNVRRVSLEELRKNPQSERCMSPKEIISYAQVYVSGKDIDLRKLHSYNTHLSFCDYCAQELTGAILFFTIFESCLKNEYYPFVIKPIVY